MRRCAVTAVRKIHKKIVINENQEPVEVVIDYADWLEIERLLGLQPTEPPKVDLQKYAGSIRMDLY
jgi:hypothetical protein